MDVKLFTLTDEKADKEKLLSTKRNIYKCVSAYFPGTDKFKNFMSQKRMLLAISQELRSCDMVIVAVQPNMYHKTKELLCKAIGSTLVQDSDLAEILKPLSDAQKISEKTYINNISYPKGSEVFPSKSFFYSGFSIKSFNQYIIFLPLYEYGDEIVVGNLYDYFSGMVDKYIKDDALKTQRKSVVSSAEAKLLKAQIRIAVSPINAFQPISDAKSINQEKKQHIIFSEQSEKREQGCTIRNYIYNCAVDARISTNSELGAAISKPFINKSDNSVFLYIALADEKATKLIKMYSKSNETANDLTNSAIIKLFDMVCDYIDSTYSNENNINDNQSEENDSNQNSATPNNKKKKTIIASGILAGIALIAGVSTSLLLSNDGISAYINSFINSIF